jgi:SAM-dependent methyltransferase
MITSSDELAAVAYALAAGDKSLTIAERLLATMEPAAALVAATKAAIVAGSDPLGDAFCKLRTPEERRGQGATYTPSVIVDAMLGWSASEQSVPARVVDAGAGSGRFTCAAAKVFGKAQLIAVENDPLAALLLRANAAVLGFSDRLELRLVDYRDLELADISGPTLFIGNPPYVRHHDIGQNWKLWLATTAQSLGVKASGLAGLHVHFFLKTRAIARPGDFGTFITASEWMDVNYGSVVRKMLADGLGGTAIHVIESKAMPFADALSTGTVTCFRVGNRPDTLVMRSVDSLASLSPLAGGRAVSWSELAPSHKWSVLIRNSPKPTSGHIELGDLFRVHRGQVSGKNAVWIAGQTARDLPDHFLFPTITRAREIIDCVGSLKETARLKRVVDLPPDLSDLTDDERLRVDRFLEWARENGAEQGFVATHRRAWWSVGLREPAPILCTYMARRPPVFLRNSAGARHLNIAHGLYPRQPLSETTLQAVIAHLRSAASTAEGRTYAGGLIKFEPREVERLHIPSYAVLSRGQSA